MHNTKYTLYKYYRHYLQHVSVQVYQFQGEQNASFKLITNDKLLLAWFFHLW